MMGRDKKLTGGPLDEVLQELRSLRKLDGTLTVKKVAACPNLVRILGEGDAFDAHAALLGWIESTSSDRDIQVAGMSLGADYEGQSYGGTVMGRLTSIGEEFHTDQRNARRWADRGLLKLATLIDGNDWTQLPFVSLDIAASADEWLVINYRFETPHERYERPSISFNGTDFDADWRIEEGQEPGRLRHATRVDIPIKEGIECEFTHRKPVNTSAVFIKGGYRDAYLCSDVMVMRNFIIVQLAPV